MVYSGLLEKIIDQGGLFAVFVLVLFFVSRFGLMVFRRLFDPPSKDSPGGLVTEWFTAQREFMEGLAKREEIQTKLCEFHNSTLGAVSRQIQQDAMRFDQTMVDFAKSRLLELSVNGNTTPEKRREIENQIEELMLAVENRHMARQ